MKTDRKSNFLTHPSPHPAEQPATIIATAACHDENREAISIPFISLDRTIRASVFLANS